MSYEFAVTDFKYRVLYLAEFLTQFDDMAEGDWPESPAWNDLVSFFPAINSDFNFRSQFNAKWFPAFHMEKRSLTKHGKVS